MFSERIKSFVCTLPKENRTVRPKHAVLPVGTDVHDFRQHDASCKDPGWTAVDHGQPTYTECPVALQPVALYYHVQRPVARHRTAGHIVTLHLPASRPGAS